MALAELRAEFTVDAETAPGTVQPKARGSGRHTLYLSLALLEIRRDIGAI